MNIVFFGGSTITDDYYKAVYTNVKELFKDKVQHTIITGGTTGTMDAVTRAAKEEGMHTVGIVLSKWEEYLNHYNDELYTFENEADRLQYMLKLGEVFICLDGDLGTLAEIFPAWVYAADVNKKIYIVGDKTKELIDNMYNNKYITYKLEKYITYSSFKELKCII